MQGGDAPATYEAFGRALLGLTVETGERTLLPIAIEQLEAALALRPSPKLLVDTVLARLEMKEPDAALAIARAGVARDRGDALAHFALGLAYRGKDLRAEAARAFGEAARLSPEWSAPREQLAGLRGP
jgi:predicted Zn-dependent protease